MKVVLRCHILPRYCTGKQHAYHWFWIPLKSKVRHLGQGVTFWIQKCDQPAKRYKDSVCTLPQQDRQTVNRSTAVVNIKESRSARSILLHTTSYQLDNSFLFHLHTFLLGVTRILSFPDFTYAKTPLQYFLQVTLKQTSFLRRLFLLIPEVYSVLNPRLSQVIHPFYIQRGKTGTEFYTFS